MKQPIRHPGLRPGDIAIVKDDEGSVIWDDVPTTNKNAYQLFDIEESDLMFVISVAVGYAFVLVNGSFGYVNIYRTTKEF